MPETISLNQSEILSVPTSVHERQSLSWSVLSLATLVLSVVLTQPILADDIAVKEIGGVPVIKCMIHHGGKQIEAHVLFDLGLDVPMVIHEQSIGGLGLTAQDVKTAREAGEKIEVDIEFASNGRWEGIPTEVGDIGMLSTLTAKYAQELGEVPVVALVGLSAIKSSVVELNLRRGMLRTLGMASEEAREQEFDFVNKPFRIVLEGTGHSQTPVKAAVFTRNADSILDISLLHAARKAGKKPNIFNVGGIKFGDHTAFRFQSVGEGKSAPINAVLGMNAIRSHIVTIWPQRKKIAFVAAANVTFPEAEQNYFIALADKNPDGVAEFITKGPRRRLMDEACLLLWGIRLEEPSSTTDMLKKVLQTISANYEPQRRCATLSSIADQLEGGDRPDKEELGMFALDLAMKQSGTALNHTAIHEVHVRLGKKAFAKGDFQQARRHLLSAAFGMPKNGECNFWMGEVYKEMDKPRRAWSRYFQSILDPDVDPNIRADSLARLDQLNRDPEFRKTFNMVVAEQYMAGRLADSEFHADSRYELVKKKFPGHVKLVEFFTDANDPKTGGMQLAFQALDEYFQGNVALISFHLNDPMHSDIAAKRLKYYDGKSALMAVFDGTPVLGWNNSEARKLSENAAENYPDFLDACHLEKPVSKSSWALDAKMAQDGPKVSGTVTVTGAGEIDKLRLHAIVCERSVMAVKKSGVFFHHFVARKALTPPDGLDLKIALEQPVEFAVDAEKMREDLTRMLSSEKSQSKPTYVDANKLMVVAFVQHQDNRRVLAAKSFSLPQEDEVP